MTKFTNVSNLIKARIFYVDTSFLSQIRLCSLIDSILFLNLSQMSFTIYQLVVIMYFIINDVNNGMSKCCTYFTGQLSCSSSTWEYSTLDSSYNDLDNVAGLLNLRNSQH